MPDIARIILVSTLLLGIAFMCGLCYLFGRWAGRQEGRDEVRRRLLAASRDARLDEADRTVRVPMPTLRPLPFRYASPGRRQLQCWTCRSFEHCKREPKPKPAPACHSERVDEASRFSTTIIKPV